MPALDLQSRPSPSSLAFSGDRSGASAATSAAAPIDGDVSSQPVERSNLAHHFNSTVQQHEAAKLGMWLFLATEVLLFGGLFCLYAVFRAMHPAVFAYGARFLDVGWGALNTAVLIISSLTMALAVWCAQCGRRRESSLFLGLTLLCGLDFLGVKVIEYSHKFHDQLVWGAAFYERPAGAAPLASASSPESGDRSIAAEAAPIVLAPGDATIGRGLFRTTCAGCHGAQGQGLPNSGKPLTTSSFVAQLDDDGMLAFLQKGRLVTDPLNTTGIAMLPRGGNPTLTDQDLAHIIAHVRVLQSRSSSAGGGAKPQASAATAQTTSQSPSVEVSAPLEPEPVEFEITKTFIPDPATASSKVSGEFFAAADGNFVESSQPRERVDPRDDPTRPPSAHLFFNVYFLMTGLHGLHVIAGMIVISVLLIATLRGRYSSRYFTPVDLGGLYWHVVDIIWIFLFPLLYLIH